MDLGDFDKKAVECDCLITGEGALDKQTAFGKAPYRAAKRFKSINVNGFAIALSGSVSDRDTYKDTIDVALSITNKPLSIKDSIQNTADLLKLIVYEIAQFLLWKHKR